MELYSIHKIESDGYAMISEINEGKSKEIPLRSLRILYETGSIHLSNPELLYSKI